jgi:tight adherence protein C
MVVDASHREGFFVIAIHQALGPLAAALTVVVLGAVTRPKGSRSLIELVSDRPATLTRSRRWRSPVSISAALVVSSLGALIAGPLVVGIAAGAAILGRKAGPIHAERRRRAAVERELPDAVDLLVLSVRAGLTPFQAVGELARSNDDVIGPAFAEVVHRTERGQPLADALAALPERLGDLAGPVADTIAISERHGLALGPALDQLTAETRATRRRLDQADARKLPVRLSFPLVTCTLPSFVLLAIAPAVIAALSSLGGPAW